MSNFFNLVTVAGFAALAFIILRYYLRWKKIRAYADAQWNEHNNEIVKAIESIGEEEPEALLLFIDGDRRYERLSINIPHSIGSPWSGRHFAIEAKDKFDVKLTSPVEKISNEYISLLVPRIKLKNGKSQNVWSASRYLNKSNVLNELLSKLNIKEREEALNYLLENAVKVNGGLSWVQNAEFPVCDVCKKRMKFIFQLSGTKFIKNKHFDIHESEIYVFGCAKHMEEIKNVIQFY